MFRNLLLHLLLKTLHFLLSLIVDPPQKEQPVEPPVQLQLLLQSCKPINAVDHEIHKDNLSAFEIAVSGLEIRFKVKSSLERGIEIFGERSRSRGQGKAGKKNLSCGLYGSSFLGRPTTNLKGGNVMVLSKNKSLFEHSFSQALPFLLLT